MIKIWGILYLYFIFMLLCNQKTWQWFQSYHELTNSNNSHLNSKFKYIADLYPKRDLADKTAAVMDEWLEKRE